MHTFAVVPDNSTSYGHFHQQHAHTRQGYPPGATGRPVQNQMMPTQNMPMNNMGFHQHPMPQHPIQHVPMQSQFPPTMPQGVSQMPMQVPIAMPAAMPVPSEHVTITPEEKKEWESAYGKKGSDAGGGKAKKKDKKCLRVAGGVLWEDHSLADWDPSKIYNLYFNYTVVLNPRKTKSTKTFH